MLGMSCILKLLKQGNKQRALDEKQKVCVLTIAIDVLYTLSQASEL